MCKAGLCAWHENEAEAGRQNLPTSLGVFAQTLDDMACRTMLLTRLGKCLKPLEPANRPLTVVRVRAMGLAGGISSTTITHKKPQRQAYLAVTLDMFDALRYLHRHGYVHADVKGENICIGG